MKNIDKINVPIALEIMRKKRILHFKHNENRDIFFSKIKKTQFFWPVNIKTKYVLTLIVKDFVLLMPLLIFFFIVDNFEVLCFVAI